MSRLITSTMPEHSYQGREPSMAERLGLGPEVRELKLGSTFTNNSSTAFHTLKYDFKPASVDVSKMANVDAGADNTMTVTVPHLDGAGTPHTVFKGSQRPHHKECVLIIDKTTGEFILEKLTANIQVKKTRMEPTAKQFLAVSNGNNSNGRPATPVEHKRSPTHGRLNGRTKVISGTKREPFVQLHPKGQSPPPQPSSSCSPAQSSNTQSTLASLPMIGSEIDDFALSTPIIPSFSFVPVRVSPPPVVVPNTKSTSLNSDEGALSDSSTSSSSSDSSDSDSDTENIPVPMASNDVLNTAANSTSIVAPLMPDNFLNEDLQLSESESDSDK
ncbi:PREDICTED: ell-associated factor Eaf [Dinoponera quadriceps]|uniref:Ell-associated factor Eaf n=1 Tax=Dinoponera quadriceps TaxID=609295 RepID=A0A6P3X901_DINQU|nr:PREDICTED: ell-associated factor Eaf [Dinoponera quadriceps]